MPNPEPTDTFFSYALRVTFGDGDGQEAGSFDAGRSMEWRRFAYDMSEDAN